MTSSPPSHDRGRTLYRNRSPSDNSRHQNSLGGSYETKPYSRYERHSYYRTAHDPVKSRYYQHHHNYPVSAHDRRSGNRATSPIHHTEARYSDNRSILLNRSHARTQRSDSFPEDQNYRRYRCPDSVSIADRGIGSRVGRSQLDRSESDSGYPRHRANRDSRDSPDTREVRDSRKVTIARDNHESADNRSVRESYDSNPLDDYRTFNPAMRLNDNTRLGKIHRSTDILSCVPERRSQPTRHSTTRLRVITFEPSGDRRSKDASNTRTPEIGESTPHSLNTVLMSPNSESPTTDNESVQVFCPVSDGSSSTNICVETTTVVPTTANEGGTESSDRTSDNARVTGDQSQTRSSFVPSCETNSAVHPSGAPYIVTTEPITPVKAVSVDSRHDRFDSGKHISSETMSFGVDTVENGNNAETSCQDNTCGCVPERGNSLSTDGKSIEQCDANQNSSGKAVEHNNDKPNNFFLTMSGNIKSDMVSDSCKCDSGNTNPTCQQVFQEYGPWRPHFRQEGSYKLLHPNTKRALEYLHSKRSSSQSGTNTIRRVQVVDGYHYMRSQDSANRVSANSHRTSDSRASNIPTISCVNTESANVEISIQKTIEDVQSSDMNGEVTALEVTTEVPEQFTTGTNASNLGSPSHESPDRNVNSVDRDSASCSASEKPKAKEKSSMNDVDSNNEGSLSRKKGSRNKRKASETVIDKTTELLSKRPKMSESVDTESDKIITDSVCTSQDDNQSVFKTKDNVVTDAADVEEADEKNDNNQAMLPNSRDIVPILMKLSKDSFLTDIGHNSLGSGKSKNASTGSVEKAQNEKTAPSASVEEKKEIDKITNRGQSLVAQKVTGSTANDKERVTVSRNKHSDKSDSDSKENKGQGGAGPLKRASPPKRFQTGVISSVSTRSRSAALGSTTLEDTTGVTRQKSPGNSRKSPARSDRSKSNTSQSKNENVDVSCVTTRRRNREIGKSPKRTASCPNNSPIDSLMSTDTVEDGVPEDFNIDMDAVKRIFDADNQRQMPTVSNQNEVVTMLTETMDDSITSGGEGSDTDPLYKSTASRASVTSSSDATVEMIADKIDDLSDTVMNKETSKPNEEPSESSSVADVKIVAEDMWMGREEIVMTDLEEAVPLANIDDIHVASSQSYEPPCETTAETSIPNIKTRLQSRKVKNVDLNDKCANKDTVIIEDKSSDVTLRQENTGNGEKESFTITVMDTKDIESPMKVVSNAEFVSCSTEISKTPILDQQEELSDSTRLTAKLVDSGTHQTVSGILKEGDMISDKQEGMQDNDCDNVEQIKSMEDSDQINNEIENIMDVNENETGSTRKSVIIDRRENDGHPHAVFNKLIGHFVYKSNLIWETPNWRRRYNFKGMRTKYPSVETLSSLPIPQKVDGAENGIADANIDESKSNEKENVSEEQDEVTILRELQPSQQNSDELVSNPPLIKEEIIELDSENTVPTLYESISPCSSSLRQLEVQALSSNVTQEDGTFSTGLPSIPTSSAGVYREPILTTMFNAQASLASHNIALSEDSLNRSSSDETVPLMMDLDDSDEAEDQCENISSHPESPQSFRLLDIDRSEKSGDKRVPNQPVEQRDGNSDVSQQIPKSNASVTEKSANESQISDKGRSELHKTSQSQPMNLDVQHQENRLSSEPQTTDPCNKTVQPHTTQDGGAQQQQQASHQEDQRPQLNVEPPEQSYGVPQSQPQVVHRPPPLLQTTAQQPPQQLYHQRQQQIQQLQLLQQKHQQEKQRQLHLLQQHQENQTQPSQQQQLNRHTNQLPTNLQRPQVSSAPPPPPPPVPPVPPPVVPSMVSSQQQQPSLVPSPQHSQQNQTQLPHPAHVQRIQQHPVPMNYSMAPGQMTQPLQTISPRQFNPELLLRLQSTMSSSLLMSSQMPPMPVMSPTIPQSAHIGVNRTPVPQAIQMPPTIQQIQQHHLQQQAQTSQEPQLQEQQNQHQRTQNTQVGATQRRRPRTGQDRRPRPIPNTNSGDTGIRQSSIHYSCKDCDETSNSLEQMVSHVMASTGNHRIATIFVGFVIPPSNQPNSRGHQYCLGCHDALVTPESWRQHFITCSALPVEVKCEFCSTIVSLFIYNFHLSRFHGEKIATLHDIMRCTLYVDRREAPVMPLYVSVFRWLGLYHAYVLISRAFFGLCVDPVEEILATTFNPCVFIFYCAACENFFTRVRNSIKHNSNCPRGAIGRLNNQSKVCAMLFYASNESTLNCMCCRQEVTPLTRQGLLAHFQCFLNNFNFTCFFSCNTSFSNVYDLILHVLHNHANNSLPGTKEFDHYDRRVLFGRVNCPTGTYPLCCSRTLLPDIASGIHCNSSPIAGSSASSLSSSPITSIARTLPVSSASSVPQRQTTRPQAVSMSSMSATDYSVTKSTTK